MKYSKGVIGLVIAAFLLPSLSIAQTTASQNSSNSALVAALEQLVAELQQELQVLIAQHANATQESPSPSNQIPVVETSPTPSSITGPTCTLTLTTSVGAGATGTDTLSWTSTNATTGTITGLGVVGPNGSQSIYGLTINRAWNGSFTGPGGTTVCSASYTAPLNSSPVAIPSLNATPSSGPAPLTVAFSVSGGGALSITFGDGGTSQTLSQTACTNSVPPSCVSQTTHTYNSPGLYVVNIENASGAQVNVQTIDVTAAAASSTSSTSTPTQENGDASNSCVAITASQTSTGRASCNGELYCPNNTASQKYYCQVGGLAGGYAWSSTPCTGQECLSL